MRERKDQIGSSNIPSVKLDMLLRQTYLVSEILLSWGGGSRSI